MLAFLRRHWLLYPALLLFLLLLARNPFSQRTLIPNLEPFPDSFHYIVPAFSFIHGKGFVIERLGHPIKPSVPPLYSLAMVPFFLIKPDVRMFYFANFILAIWAFLLFYIILRTLFRERSIQFLLLFLYATSMPLTWFPELAMAENLILLLFLEAILLLVSPVKPRRAMLAGFVSVAFYATKYASLPLTIVFPILYFAKLLTVKNKQTQTAMKWLLGSLVVCGGLYCGYESVAKHNNVIAGLTSLFFAVVFPKPAVGGSGSGGGGSFFGTQFMATNIKAYGGWLFGNPITILWKQVTILPKVLAWIAMLGLVSGLSQKGKRFASAAILLLLGAVIAFMSVFYAYDGRYFFIAIPSLFLGIGLACSWLFSTLPKKGPLISLVIVGMTVLFLILNARALKFSIALNLKYAETPWYYVSVQTFDTYLQEHHPEFTKTPVVISALPPYLIDAYAKTTFIDLPLSPSQEFRSTLPQAFGDYDFAHLDQVYAGFLRAGNPVFLTQYGLGNEGYLHESFNRLLKEFSAKKVVNGCFELCDVYELHLPSQK